MFNIYDQGQAAQLHKEILLLTKVECDAVITLKGAFHDEGAIGIIMEYMDRGSLEFITRKDVTMTESVMAAITFQIIWGLGYLHYENQIHRDVKPANILMVGVTSLSLPFPNSLYLSFSLSLSNRTLRAR
jgi:serine/threonine protein kinase